MKDAVNKKYVPDGVVWRRRAHTSSAFCSEDVQSSSSETDSTEASGAALADKAGEDLGAEAAEATAAAEAAAADAPADDGADFADKSVLTVDIRPLASCARKVFTLATTSSGVRVPATEKTGKVGTHTR